MKLETISRGNITVRKEAVVGVSQETTSQTSGDIKLYLLGGQTIVINTPVDQLEENFRAWKRLANLDQG